MYSKRKEIRDINNNQIQLQQMSNQWNAEQAEITRNWQETMMNKQNDWNLAQWNRENEYNSPTAKSERLKQAGINPAFGLGDANTAGSVTSASAGASPTPQTTAPTLQSGAGVSALDVVSGISQIFQQADSIAGTYLDFESAPYRNASAINGNFEWLDPSYRKIRQSFSPIFAHNSVGKSNEELYGMRIGNISSAAVGAYNYLKAEEQSILNKYLPADKQAELFTKAASWYNLVLDGQMKRGELKKQVVDYLSGVLDLEDKSISNNIKRRTANGIIDALNSENAVKKESFDWDLKNGVPYSESMAKYLKSQLDIQKLRDKFWFMGKTPKGRDSDSSGAVLRRFGYGILNFIGNAMESGLPLGAILGRR